MKNIIKIRIMQFEYGGCDQNRKMWLEYEIWLRYENIISV